MSLRRTKSTIILRDGSIIVIIVAVNFKSLGCWLEVSTTQTTCEKAKLWFFSEIFHFCPTYLDDFALNEGNDIEGL